MVNFPAFSGFFHLKLFFTPNVHQFWSQSDVSINPINDR